MIVCLLLPPPSPICPSGGCTFDDGPAQCDYQQDPYDDFDWTHVSAQEVPYLSPELPQGKQTYSYCEFISVEKKKKTL